MKKHLIFAFSIFIAAVNVHAQDTIKIMPVGNSITAGEHYRYPPIEEREGFRKPLYEMLVDSGYLVDFVGTQKHGERPVTDPDWYDWNNEAYPGWKIPDIAEKTADALPLFFPDILLVHVGTNGSSWDSKPGQVMNMLNSINQFSVDNNHGITVFLCKIINRYITQDQAPTTLFNTRVEQAVAARSGDSIQIIMVDMENGAGIDYSDNLPDSSATPPYEGGDMLGTRYPGVPLDKFHPNDKGNYKMALKYYQELVKVLPEPQITSLDIPVRHDIKIYPNPASHNAQIDLGKEYYSVNIMIRGITGTTLAERSFSNTRFCDLGLDAVEPGVLFVTVTINKDEQVTLRLVKY
jgi:lysophospholipase L1-like esterase